MKILQFDQKVPPEAPRRTSSASPGRKEGKAFEAELQKAGSRASNVVDKISSENLLAIQGADLKDVGAAGSLLSSLLASVRSSSPEALQKVHDMDGILYYFQI